MTADAWTFYDAFLINLGNKVMDLDGDTFKMQLHTSTYSPSATADNVKADLSNEVANGNGYTTGGYTLTSMSWSGTTTITWDAADATWTASGGSITCRYAVIVDDTPTSPADPLCCYTTLDNTPADITINDTETLNVQFHANGIMQLS